jgi:small GTP-binding protein
MDSKKESFIDIKLVVVGDGGVGKTCILLSKFKDEFPTESVPTVFENYIADIKLDGKNIKANVW